MAKATFDIIRDRVAAELALIYRGDREKAGHQEIQAAIYAIDAVVVSLTGVSLSDKSSGDPYSGAVIVRPVEKFDAVDSAP